MGGIRELHEFGQAIWYDNIRRSLLDSGELQILIDEGATGVTSNPTIFEKAIAGSEDYDEDLERLIGEGTSVEGIFWALATDDIRRTADLLRPAYDRTDGIDGYVSLEVNPALAHNTEETISEAQRLSALLDRPNVLIKVPATPAGIPAIEALIAQGVNVNITLIFSVDQYVSAAEAYIAGLEKRAASGGDLARVASVASFFVSRVDTAVDKVLEEIGEKDLQGKAAIANAKVAYARFREIFSGARWESLAARGARVQRPLWASTGTKNPRYADTLYIDGLIGPDTVNTVPPATLQAFLDHGTVAPTLEAEVDQARDHLTRLAEMGLDLDETTGKLLDDGVASFAGSFDALMESITEKRNRFLSEWKDRSARLGSHQTAVFDALSEVVRDRIAARIWNHDHTVWKPDPGEITNRLGWLRIAEVMRENVQSMQELAEEVRAGGYTHAVLCGMGGSSLAPEVLRNTFGVAHGYLDLAVLDSTSPGAVQAHADRLDMSRTLFVVSTKSGTTVETLSFFKFFYNNVADAVGSEQAGEHFIAITDPGSSLAELAERYRFRRTFLNDPNIGGRYSALSYFGLVPAALIGIDITRLLEGALVSMRSCESREGEPKNPGVWLGVILGELAKIGRDKLTLIVSDQAVSFGNWVEQLLAESTGKEGKGILPVVGESLGPVELYRDDRLFVDLRMEGDDTGGAEVQALEEAGHPVVRLRMRDIYDLGRQFFLWEMATAVAGHCLAINPFDQPDVESAKVLARKMVSEYVEKGVLPTETPLLSSGDIVVYGDVTAGSPEEALTAFIGRAQEGAYITLQAYVQPTGETDKALQAFRTRLRDQFRLATTVGYGPRFLHSTGQLHKGDAGHGLFIQFTTDSLDDVPIPDEAGSAASSISFGTLQASQAMGDRRALLDAGRQVIRFHLGRDVVGNLKALSYSMGA